MPRTGPITKNIDFSATGAQEVLQNVGIILATRAGTVPLDRQFGLSWNQVDDPRPIAAQQLKAEVAEAISKYEPRATVEQIEVSASGPDGRLKPTVTVSIDLDAA